MFHDYLHFYQVISFERKGFLILDSFKIQNVTIQKTAALAPMASVADRAFRILCKQFGASYMVSEMVSSKGLCYGDTKSAQMLTVTPEEKPMAVQLFGSDPAFMAKAAQMAAQYSPQIIDINMGCPVNKVVSGNGGCALMKNPSLASEIVYAVKNSVSLPVTVKFRKGWDNGQTNTVAFAKAMVNAGADALTVHPRTRVQMYSGKADWDIITAVKQAVTVPVIGNGDVFNVEDAVRMYEQTGCDLVMIGRASYGRPWIFQQVEHWFKTGTLLPDPSISERFSVMEKHILMICADKGERTGLAEARKHIAWYLKGIPSAAALRNECMRISTMQDFLNFKLRLTSLFCL